LDLSLSVGVSPMPTIAVLPRMLIRSLMFII